MASAIDDTEVQVIRGISRPSITQYCIQLENDA